MTDENDVEMLARVVIGSSLLGCTSYTRIWKEKGHAVSIEKWRLKNSWVGLITEQTTQNQSLRSCLS
jgi:hypothetical protein